MQKVCLNCEKVFDTYPSRRKRRYCTKVCYDTSEEKREWASKLHKGKKAPYARPPHYQDEKHPFWKGKDVGYVGLHMWVTRKLGKPKRCEHCGQDGLTGRQIHWANKSGEYKRDLDDWLRLCAKCHKKYDGHSEKLKNYIKCGIYG